MTTTILVLSGGGPAPSTPVPRADLVIAADSGFALAESLGVTVDLVVGDLDSIEPADLEQATHDQIDVVPHPTDKDATDLELAVLAAVDRGAERVVVAGGGAGRLDHLLGVAGLLADDRWAALEIEWHAGHSIAHVVRGARTLEVAPNTLVSIIPVTDVEASITGTRWTLDRAVLRRGTTRGVSNEAIDDTVTVTAHSGVLLAVTTRSDHQ